MPTKKPQSFSPNEIEAILGAADSTPLNSQLVEFMSSGPEQNKKLKLYEDFGNLRIQYIDLKEGKVTRDQFDAQRKAFTEKLAALTNSGIHSAKELVKESLDAMDKQIKEIVGRDLP